MGITKYNLSDDPCASCGHRWGSHGQGGCCSVSSSTVGMKVYVSGCSCTQAWYARKDHPQCFMCLYNKVKDKAEFCAKGYWNGGVGNISASDCADFSDTNQGVECECGADGALYGPYAGQPMCDLCYAKFEEGLQ
jgi:hypothetical protein